MHAQQGPTVPPTSEQELTVWRNRQLSCVEASLELAMAAVRLEYPSPLAPQIGANPKSSTGTVLMSAGEMLGYVIFIDTSHGWYLAEVDALNGSVQVGALGEAA